MVLISEQSSQYPDAFDFDASIYLFATTLG